MERLESQFEFIKRVGIENYISLENEPAED